MQELAGPRRRAADAAATGEVVERVEREYNQGLAQVTLGKRLHLVVAGSALQPPLDREPEHRDRRRGRLRVDDADPVADLRGGTARALHRSGEPAGDVERVDALVPAELVVDGAEVAPRRLRGRRHHRQVAQPGVELVRPELDVVAEALVAEANVERHDPPVGKALRRVWEVGRRVEDDRCVACVELHYPAGVMPAAPRIAATISSRSSSLLRQATAPASRRAWRSRMFAEAVRPITAAPG